MPHEIEELEKKIGVTFGMSTPRASISSRRFSVTNPELDKLRQRRLELRHDPAVAEDAKLRKQIEKIEKELHTAQREEKKHEEAQVHAPGGGGRNQLHRSKSNDGVMFLARPKIRAYFHHDELFRSRGDHEYAATSSVSLFTELLFVGVLAETGGLIDESGISLLEFMVAFLPGWRMWCYVRDIVSIYEMNAVSQRFLVLWILSILIGFTLNIDEDLGPTKYMATGLYCMARYTVGAINIVFLIIFPHFRLFHFWNAVTCILPTFLWIGALWIEYPINLVVQWLSFLWDWFPYYILFLSMTCYGYVTSNPKYYGKPLMDLMEYYPAVDMEIRSERTGAFVTMVLGYMVINLFYQSAASIGFNAFFGKATLGLMIAWALNWLYFDVDSKHQEHAMARNFWYTIGYNMSMNALIMGWTLAGAALPRIVLACDYGNSNPGQLTETFAVASYPTIGSYLRWYFCCGLAIGTISMSFLQLLHKSKNYNPRIPRRWRVAVRFGMCLVWAMLPFAEDKLNSLVLLSIVTGTLYLCLFTEIYGQSPKGSLVFSWKSDFDTGGYEQVHSGNRRMIRTIYGFF